MSVSVSLYGSLWKSFSMGKRLFCLVRECSKCTGTWGPGSRDGQGLFTLVFGGKDFFYTCNLGARTFYTGDLGGKDFFSKKFRSFLCYCWFYFFY
jgi:hypothetical protein